MAIPDESLHEMALLLKALVSFHKISSSVVKASYRPFLYVDWVVRLEV